MAKTNLPRINNVLRLVSLKGRIADINMAIVFKLGHFSLGEETPTCEKNCVDHWDQKLEVNGVYPI